MSNAKPQPGRHCARNAEPQLGYKDSRRTMLARPPA